MVDIASWEQPALFSTPKPVRIRFDVLVDPLDETVILVIEAKDVLTGSLIALQSSSPVAFADAEWRAREFGVDFTRLLRDHTAPFP